LSFQVSASFEFLRSHGKQLYRFAAQAEHYFRTDPNTTLMKLRQFAELLAKEVAARTGSLRSADDRFVDILGELGRSGYVPGQAMTLFHQLRTDGNEAVHGDLDDFAVALTGLKVARQLAVWFVRSYGGQPKFKPGPFVPPPAPVDLTAFGHAFGLVPPPPTNAVAEVREQAGQHAYSHRQPPYSLAKLVDAMPRMTSTTDRG